MRRDKTLRICANHFIQSWMQLKAMNRSERAWMWLVQADFAGKQDIKLFTFKTITNFETDHIPDEEAKTETLAIRFANADNAKKFKNAFDAAVVSVIEWEADRIAIAESKLKSPKPKLDETSEKDEAPQKQDDKNDKSTESASEKLTSLSIKD